MNTKRVLLIGAGLLAYAVVAVSVFYILDHAWLSSCGRIRISFALREPSAAVLIPCLLSGLGVLAYLPLVGLGATFLARKLYRVLVVKGRRVQLANWPWA
ncbi:hypothetical protein [Cupriavidus nantongensis]|uniref:hypothetical protein n=1 Tax=Cupriavidus nantongensis TaxID=1796606 RepID=UPI0012376D7F|nr:hypothetical protein [Cupriavidus nantongensis]